MTTSVFKYIDPSTLSTTPGQKAWSKVDDGGRSFKLADHRRDVYNIRDNQADFSTDNAGFSVHVAPAAEKSFTDDAAVRGPYYDSVKEVLKQNLPSGQKIKKIVIFDHTIRRRNKSSPRQPVQQVHVDQTPESAVARVRRHLPHEEAEQLLKNRWQLINVWRPIENPASDYPLAVVDWRSTKPKDFVRVDLMYPKRDSFAEDDDRGKETLPTVVSNDSTEGYEVRGETYAVQPSDDHRFYYTKDMTPEEVLFIKCFDSHSETLQGEKGNGISHCTPHTAFEDPNTPANAPGRQSIEVRCLVFYE